MKKIFLAGLIYCSLAAGAQPLKEFELSGDISQLKDRARVDSIWYSMVNQPRAAVAVHNSRFVIKGTVEEPCRMILYYPLTINAAMVNADPKLKQGEKKMVFTALYIQPGKMKFIAGKTMEDHQLQGSPDAALFDELMKQITDAGQKAEHYTERFKPDTGNPADTTGYAAAFRLKIAAIRNAYNSIGSSFVRNHKNSPVCFTALNYMSIYDGRFELDSLEYYFDQLSQPLRASYSGQRINRFLKTGVGRILQDFEQADTSGNIVKLSSFRGKYVLIDFWGSWCGWCRAESPYQIALFNKYKDKGFTILSVASESKKEKWLDAIHKDGTGIWTHVSDLKGENKNVVNQMLGVTGSPYSILIDPSGKILGSGYRDNPQALMFGAGNPKLADKLKEIFGE